MKTNYINTVSHTVLLFLLFALAGWTKTYAQVGAINGMFTINSDGDQVYFSQGNLQYQASTNTWKFAENQYDYVGTANRNISQTYDGWIDLFGWGTSGYDHGAICYQPWSTSTTNSDYYAYGMDTYNLFDHDGRADWGYNAIINGGMGWRTLTKDEWSYLFNTRSTTSDKRFAKAQVNGVNGVILLPDDWNSSIYNLSNTNSTNASFTGNTLSITQWNTLENAGAVFLPTAGYRDGTSVSYVGSEGYYWSASYNGTSNAWIVHFSSSYLYPGNYNNRHIGQSVRLVRSVQNCSINAIPNCEEGGVVSGAGTYIAGAECTLTATASAGYTFAYWTENGRVVSEDAIYNFIVVNNRVLEANFALSISTGNLNGQFTVGNNTVVCFSQGNLQYQASTNTWCFAENQWDYIGADNHHITDTYSGLIDLFGWGTSGYDHGAVCYQPWSTSNNNSDYYAYGSDTYNLYDETGQADWGYNAISNGGNTENNGWRTLNQTEWNYLFYNRTTASGIRYAKARVNGVNGVILLPDNWSSSTYSLRNTNSTDAAYASNIISSTQWIVLEQHGAVFLPAAGYRNGTSVGNAGSYGYYWSASCHSSSRAYSVYFYGGNLYTSDGNRYYGQSVRLVCPAQNCSLGINAIPSPPGGGAVSGSGAYEEGTECTLTATPTPGFSFLNWTENGQVVAMFPQYSFTVNESRKLVANFVNANIITFADANVKALCVANWDTNGDGELSYEEAAAVIVLSSTFQNDTTITTFDELCYFTGLTDICNQAFSGCDKLNSITLPETVAVIGADAFDGCTALTSVHYTGTISQWCALHFVNGMSNPLNYAGSFYVDGTPTQNVVIPEGVTNIGNYAFYNYDNLLSLSLPNTLTNIGNYAFYDCDGLTSITVSEGVSQIGTDAFVGCDNVTEVYFNATSCGSGYLFQNCPNLHTIHIGENVQSLPDYVFYHCTNLQAIYSEATTPPVINYTVFPSGCTSLPLYVPCGSKADYQADPLWGFFTNYIEMCPYEITAIANPSEGGTVTGAGTYECDAIATLTATANRGYLFVNWTENGVEVSTEAIYTFTVTQNRNLVANFEEYHITNHWTPESSSYSETMSLYGIIQIDGVEQFSDWLEVGVFCGDECRGSAIASEFFLTQRYLVILNIYGETGQELTFKLYDHGVGQELDLVSPEAVTFNVNGYGNPVEPYVLNFASIVEIAATISPAEAGTVTGIGSYPIGSTCTLSAEANAGYQFGNWMLDGVVVSTDASFEFVVTGEATYVAHFNRIHTRALEGGWNWWSTFIEQEGANGLTMLENSLGGAGIRVQGRYGTIDQFEYQGSSYWYGSLTSIANEQMYKIRTSAACDAELVGDEAQLSDHPISINGGWNWIGFPSGQSIEVNAALSGFEAEANDIIKGRNSSATFVSYGSYNLWYGSMSELEPGQGYMYKSNSNTSKELVFQTGREVTSGGKSKQEPRFFSSSHENYADNMLVTAVVQVEDEELRSEEYEVAAYVGDECRGAIRMMYLEPFDRYVAFLLVFGETGDDLRFALTDGSHTVWSDNHATFAIDGVVGTPTEPVILHFNNWGVNDHGDVKVNVFPNPSHGVFTVEGEDLVKVSVMNAFGQVILSKEVSGNQSQIDLSGKTGGVYMLQIVTSKGVTTKQLIKE